MRVNLGVAFSGMVVVDVSTDSKLDHERSLCGFLIQARTELFSSGVICSQHCQQLESVAVVYDLTADGVCFRIYAEGVREQRMDVYGMARKYMRSNEKNSFMVHYVLPSYTWLAV